MQSKTTALAGAAVLACAVLCYLRLEGRKKHASSLHKGAIVCILTVHPTDGSQDATRAIALHHKV